MKRIRIYAAFSFALCCCTWLGIASTCSADWVAGRDFALNERPNGPQELVNPNPTVPPWSYGWRTTMASTSLTLMLPADHANDIHGHSNLDGWIPAEASVVVNAGLTPIIENFGFGPLEPIDPKEMALHSLASTFAVVRWTAPYSATYTIDAYWDDIDTHGGAGASGHIVVNGTSIHDAFWGDGGGSITTEIQALNAGDTVDFLLGPNGDNVFDSTAFDATIVPEPSSLVLVACGAACCVASLARRRRSA